MIRGDAFSAAAAAAASDIFCCRVGLLT